MRVLEPASKDEPKETLMRREGQAGRYELISSSVNTSQINVNRVRLKAKEEGY